MYIYNLLETDFANKVCMKDNHAYHVRLLENFHSRMINQACDVGGLHPPSQSIHSWPPEGLLIVHNNK